MIKNSRAVQKHERSRIYGIHLLPDELVIHIFTFLSRKDCKTSRLVSKAWSVLAADHTFETVYIRPNSQSLKSLNAIAHHSFLHSRVRKLYFDLRPFELNLTKLEYLRLLIQQMRLGLELLPSHCS